LFTIWNLNTHAVVFRTNNLEDAITKFNLYRVFQSYALEAYDQFFGTDYLYEMEYFRTALARAERRCNHA